MLLLVFAAWLGISSLTFALVPAGAAPPDGGDTSKQEELAASGDESPAVRPDKPVDDDATAEKDAAARDKDTGPHWLAGLASIRRRGLEAPVNLRRSAPDEAIDEPPDKGDGQPRRERSAPDDKKPDRQAGRTRNIRIWPMKANSYTFTQAFGCVPQIANFYFPGEGCPADAPVVHSGVDLAAPEGTPFYAAASGWVTDSGYDREVGVPNTRIIIQHDGRNEGFATEYLHWVASYVEVGDYVEAGQQIGETGNVGYSTGPHLHFSVVELDTGEHIDPVAWLPDEPGQSGYRGIKPNARAEMRLPPGTTAGLPESADPAPPPPPVRQDVPESPPAQEEGKRDKKGQRKKEKRKERKKEARRTGAASDETAESSSADKTNATGETRDRTRKRDRAKDGKQDENAARGDDGKRKKADEGSDSSHDGRSSKKERRDSDQRNHGGDRRDNGKNHRGDKQHEKRDNAPHEREKAPRELKDGKRSEKSADTGDVNTGDPAAGEENPGDTGSPSADETNAGGSGGEATTETGDDTSAAVEEPAADAKRQRAKESESPADGDETPADAPERRPREKDKPAAES